ncbi:MAG: DUF5615 family PIN-like protein [Cyclobacteriaceae bacterium]
MKFLIDAQLPASLATLLRDKGHDAIHTLSLPEKNFSTDDAINKISIKDRRILISKDSDFYHSFILKREPYKFLLVRVGNLKKDKVNNLILDNLETIVKYFEAGYMVEITQTSIKLLF